MIYLKTIRKPYLAFFLSSILLVVSCTNNTTGIEENFEEYNLSTFITEQIEISKELSESLVNENNIDLEFLNEQTESFDVNEIESILERANFNDSKRVTNLLSEMHANGQKLMQSNPEYSELTENELNELIEVEIYNQGDKAILFQKSMGPCEDQKDTAEYRCERNWVISMATIIAVSVATFGTGYIASAVATGIFANCMNEAQSDYENCVG